MRAAKRGVAVEGICLYPIANRLGWDNHCLCPNGVLSHDVVVGGQRSMHASLAEAIRTFTTRFAA